MGILNRLFGRNDTDAATPSSKPATPTDRPAGEPVTLRLSRRSKPWVRDDQYGSGNVGVNGRYELLKAR